MSSKHKAQTAPPTLTEAVVFGVIITLMVWATVIAWTESLPKT
jgi:hypothetical protein